MKQALGNTAFSAGNYADAVKHFTDAIGVDAANHVFYSNRSAAYAALNDYDAALTDADKTVAIKPDWVKGYSRKGAALYGLKRYDDACDAYNKGLEIDGTNDACKSGLADAETAAVRAMGAAGPGGDPMGSIGAMLSSPELYGKLATNPATRGFLSQPDFIAMLTDVQKNPDKFGSYMSDPRMMQVLSVALGVNVMSGEDAMNNPDGMFKGASNGASEPEVSKPSNPAKPTPAPEPMVVDEPSGPKAEAKQEKTLGNAAYKAKNFDVALEHYDKAIALDDTDISFITNKAAVFFEKGDYEACAKACDDAVEKGRELRVDYKLVGKAMTRKGNALVKLERFEEAIAVYNKSLMEDRNADTLKTAQRDGTTTQRPQDEGVPRPGQGGGGTGTRQHFVQGAEVPGGCAEVHRGYRAQPRRPPRVFQQSRVLYQAHRVQRSYEGEFLFIIVWAIRLTSCFV